MYKIMQYFCKHCVKLAVDSLTNRAAEEHVQEPLDSLVSTDNVPFAIWCQIQQQLLHKPTMLDLEGGHVRFRYNTAYLL